METEKTGNYQWNTMQRILSAALPTLLIATGYVDPGKWAAAVEGGARFGSDLITLMLIFNFAAILCHYLSARIAVITGRDLAQICSEEYDKVTCIFLGVQAEVSLIVLDITTILGMAHGLNLMFGVDLFTGVFLTAVDAALFPIFASFLENGWAKFICMAMASALLFPYIFGVLFSQPEMPLSVGGILTKLGGESAYAMMSLLGSTIMPHNFYLHSSVVQQDQRPANLPNGIICHDHFLSILCIFSGIFLVNYVLMNSAANVFYSTGLGLLTFQDALSLMDQVFRTPIAPFTLIVALFISNHITALTWNLGRQVVLHDFFRMDIPGWLHHVTIRIIAIIPALYCVWNSGAEGMYQLLVFTQVMVAIVLPASVIPLFRVALSRSIMGAHKVSQCLEFLALITFMGMLGLKIVFVVEMIFGNGDWASNLRWSMGSSASVPFVVLLMTAFFSFCLMLWLAATPLKSASSRSDAPTLNWNIQTSMPEPYEERNKNDFSGTKYYAVEPLSKPEAELSLEQSFGSHPNVSISSTDINLPDTLLDTDSRSHLSTIEENCSDVTIPSTCTGRSEESATLVEPVLVSTACNEMSDGSKLQDAITPAITELADVEKTLAIEGESQAEKYDQGDAWELEESNKATPGSHLPLACDGPGSFRSLSGKSDDTGSGTGSLSRLAGLGRAARRQLTTVLDEFWGQLFDFHGLATEEAKAKKLDVVLGIDSKVDPKSTSASLNVDNSGKEFTGYFSSVSRGSDALMNSSLYDSPKLQKGQIAMESSFGIQRMPSSSRPNHMQLLDAYVQNPSLGALDSGERRYSSMRLPPPSDGYDQQPATVHGYQFASFLNRMAKERNSDCLNGQLESLPLNSQSVVASNRRDQHSLSLRQKPQNGLSTAAPPGFANVPMLQLDRTNYGLRSPQPAEIAGSTVYAKKFHSLPDISGLSLSHQGPLSSDSSAQWGSSMKYGSSIGHTIYERSMYTNPSKATTSLAFDEVSPKFRKDAYPLQFSASSDTGSLWYKQPFEQFGVADKTPSVDSEGVRSRHSSVPQESVSSIDLEAKLLKSLRYCIVKLLKLEGSDWLFTQNDGADEDLIDRVAARERFLYEVETREMSRGVYIGESQKVASQRNEDADYTKFLVTSVPNCGEGCVWRVDLIISFGVWCIHRILQLSLMESRPELWGKYTYVLNRLQGIIDLGFSKPRTPTLPCFCLQIPASQQQRSSPSITNGSLPPPAKQARGKCTTAAVLLDMIKDVEIAISCRKGRTGTAAGDVAFPKGKENLASVLKRYKRRLSNKQVGSHEGVSGSRKVPTCTAFG